MACLFGHKWDGCKCSKCGKTRDEQHDWDLCKGKCKRCEKTQAEQHDWNGCKCSRCGKTRDEQHDWNENECTRCGKIYEEVSANTQTTETQTAGTQTTAIIKCKNCNNVCMIKTMGDINLMLEFDMMPKCQKCGSKKYSLA